MEKRGAIERELTNDTEGRLPKGQKQADAKTAAERLDDDFTKRAAETTEKRLGR